MPLIKCDKCGQMMLYIGTFPFKSLFKQESIGNFAEITE